MEIATARSVLGVSAEDDWWVVRDAYRALIRTTHPDLVGVSGIEYSVRVNDAYRTLAIARREGRLDTEGEPGKNADPTVPPRPERRSPARADGPVTRPIVHDVSVAGGDTLLLKSTPAESFRRLVEAANALGEISYIDRSSAIFEAILHLEDGTHASFVVSLQWRAHDVTCEAFCTLEALNRAESLDVSGVLEQLAQVIPAAGDSHRS